MRPIGPSHIDISVVYCPTCSSAARPNVLLGRFPQRVTGFDWEPVVSLRLGFDGNHVPTRLFLKPETRGSLGAF